MDIQLSRVIKLSISVEILREQLTFWAVLAGFSEVPALPDRWVFRRGSSWEHTRLKDDFDQLCAFLCATPGAERDQLGEKIRRRWQGTQREAFTRKELAFREK